MKKYLLVVLAVALCLGNIYAQEKGKNGKCKNPEMKTEMKAYFEQNVYPALKEKHDKMDASFNKADLAKLQTLRAENSALHAEKKTLMQKVKAEYKNSDVDRETIKAKYQNEFSALREKHKSIGERTRPIIESNKDMIRGIMEEMKPLHEKWRADKDALLEKHGVESCKGKKPGAFSKHHGHKGSSHKGEGAEHPKGEKGNHSSHVGKGEGHQMKKVIRFVLWDGNPKASPDNSGFRSTDNKNLSLGQNYPNPAINTTNLSFTLPEDMKNVQIDVLSLQGKTVKHFSYPNLSKGNHTEQIDISGLAPGTYLYTITAGSFSETKKMVVGSK